MLKEKIKINFNKTDGFNSSICTLDSITLSVHSGTFLFDDCNGIDEFSQKVVRRLAQIGHDRNQRIDLVKLKEILDDINTFESQIDSIKNKLVLTPEKKQRFI